MLSRFFWICYDNLGGLFLINLIWSLLNVPYLILAYGSWQLGLNFGGVFLWAGLLLGIDLLFLSPTTLIIYSSGSNWVRGHENTLSSSLAVLKKYFLRAQLLQFVSLVVKFILVMNVAFYSQMSDWIGLLLTGLMMWALFIFLIFSFQIYPLLVTQDTTVITTIKFALMLSISHPIQTIWNFFVFVLYILLGLISGVGLFLGIYATYVLWATFRCKNILSIYSHKTPEPVPSRSFRELIRPWEN